MFRYLYEWTQNLAFYMVLITAVLHAVPESGYKKYIRFFTGMVMILMIVTPLFRLFGADSQIMNFYKSREYEAKLKEIEEAAGYLEDTDSFGMLESVQEESDRQGEESGRKEQADRRTEESRRKEHSIIVEEIRIEGED